jgi:hypothetical protein
MSQDTIPCVKALRPNYVSNGTRTTYSSVHFNPLCQDIPLDPKHLRLPTYPKERERYFYI